MKFIEKRLKASLILIILAITTFFSLGKTFQYYFYTDDYATLYYVQNNLNFGWPYQFVVPFYKFFYNFFGLSEKGYFITAVISFFIASIAIYFLIKNLTKSKLIGTASSAIFATGYIGLDQFTMMNISIINNFNILVVISTLYLFIKWIDSKKVIFYLITIAFFTFSLAVLSFRAFPLILFLITIETILSFKVEPIKKFIKSFSFIFLRYIPFILIGYHFGIFTYGSRGGAGNLVVTISELFAILGRLFLEPITSTFNISLHDSAVTIGIILFVVTSVVAFLAISRGKYSRLGRSLIIVLFLTIEGYIGNLILLPSFDSNGAVNRYLTVSFIGYCAIVPILTFIIAKKISSKLVRLNTIFIFFYIPTLILIIFLSLSSRRYESQILENRSIPAREFYIELMKFVPNVSSQTIFYFDRADYFPVPSQFGSIIIGAYMSKEVTLAVPYKVNIGLIKIIEDFDLLKDAIGDNKNKVYVFYYDEKGLHETTQTLLSLLKKGSRQNISINKAKQSGLINPKIEVASGKRIYTISPVVFDFNLRIYPVNSDSLTYPFCDFIKYQKSCSEVKKIYEGINKESIFSYLISRKNYYKNVKAIASSSHVAGKNEPELLVDDRLETYWLANQFELDAKKKPWILLDLMEEKRIDKIIWRPLQDHTPLNYEFYISSNRKDWKRMSHKKVTKLEEENVISFDPIKTKYIKIVINKAENDSTPGIHEIEVVEDKYSNIDRLLALRVKNDPFEFIENESDLQNTYKFIEYVGELTIRTFTNKDENIINPYSLSSPIFLDGLEHQYSVEMKPRGTTLKKVSLELNFPAIMEINNLTVSSYTY